MFCPISVLPVKTVTLLSAPMWIHEATSCGVRSASLPETRAPDSCMARESTAQTSSPAPTSFSTSRRLRIKLCCTLSGDCCRSSLSKLIANLRGLGNCLKLRLRLQFANADQLRDESLTQSADRLRNDRDSQSCSE